MCDRQRHLSSSIKSLSDDDVTLLDSGLQSTYTNQNNKIRSTCKPLPSSAQAENSAKNKLDLAQLKN